MAAVSINPGISTQHISSNSAAARVGGISNTTELAFSNLSRREVLENWFMFIVHVQNSLHSASFCCSSFMFPHVQGILSFMRCASLVQASAGSSSKGAEGVCIWYQS